MRPLYRYIPVLRREEQRIVLYNCFQIVDQSLFTVQSADYISSDSDAARIQQLQAQFFELLLEEPPEIRNSLYTSLAEAIDAFDREFAE